MDIKRKYNIENTSYPIDGIYNYNVQVLISVDGGNNYYYCGIGRFTKTLSDAHKYIAEYKAAHDKE